MSCTDYGQARRRPAAKFAGVDADGVAADARGPDRVNPPLTRSGYTERGDSAATSTVPPRPPELCRAVATPSTTLPTVLGRVRAAGSRSGAIATAPQPPTLARKGRKWRGRLGRTAHPRQQASGASRQLRRHLARDCVGRFAYVLGVDHRTRRLPRVHRIVCAVVACVNPKRLHPVLASRSGAYPNQGLDPWLRLPELYKLDFA